MTKKVDIKSNRINLGATLIVMINVFIIKVSNFIETNF